MKSLIVSFLVFGFLGTAFAQEAVVCTKLGAKAGAAVGLGLGAGLDLGVCKASNGKRWLELSPTGTGISGMISYATVHCFKESRTLNSPEKILGSSVNYSDVAGLLLAGEWGADSKHQPGHLQGGGIGVGFTFGETERSLDLRIPLPAGRSTDFAQPGSCVSSFFNTKVLRDSVRPFWKAEPSASLAE